MDQSAGRRTEKGLAWFIAALYVAIGLWLALSHGEIVRLLALAFHAGCALFMIAFDYDSFYARHPSVARHPTLEAMNRVLGWCLLLMPAIGLAVTFLSRRP